MNEMQAIHYTAREGATEPGNRCSFHLLTGFFVGVGVFMEKPRKLLRKLLANYKEGLVKKPYTSGNSEVVDCIEIIIERLSNDKHA